MGERFGLRSGRLAGRSEDEPVLVGAGVSEGAHRVREFGQLGLRVRCCASSAHQGLELVAELVGDGRGDQADEVVAAAHPLVQGRGPHAHPVSDGLHRQRGKSVGGQDVAAGLNDVVERGASRGRHESPWQAIVRIAIDHSYVGYVS